jgi:molybdopterin-guanine dinucleotide biosynthesis protein A
VTNVRERREAGVLGAVLAGGKSSRYGAPKARARLGGVTLAQRTRDALQAVVERVVLLADDPLLAEELGLEDRADRLPGAGPLGAVSTALHWARTEDRAGALVLACDLPLVTPRLLALLIEQWDGRSVMVPASEGPLGVEPLAGIYSVGCLPAIDRALEAGVRAMGDALGLLPVRTLHPELVARVGEPSRLFLNVNRPSDRDRAERVLMSAGGRTP